MPLKTKGFETPATIHNAEITMTWSNTKSATLTLKLGPWCYKYLTDVSGGGGLLTLTYPVTLGKSYCFSFGSNLANVLITVKMDGVLIHEYSALYVMNGFDSFIAKFPPCGEGAPPCSAPELPILEVETITPADYAQIYGFDWCSVEPPSARFQPLFQMSHNSQTISFRQDFEISPCYDASTNTWYPIVSGGKIKFNSILGICWENLDGADKIPINSFDDLHNVNIVNEVNYCDVKEDFYLHFDYSNFTRSDLIYFIIPVIELHENIHKEKFENLMNNEIMGIKRKFNENLPEMSFEDLFNFYAFECQDNFRDLNYVKQKYKDHFEEILDEFEIVLYEEYQKYKKNNDFENETHNDPRINSLINDYLDELYLPISCNN